MSEVAIWITAVATAGAALGAFLAARATGRASESQAFWAFWQRYSEPSMLEAIEFLSSHESTPECERTIFDSGVMFDRKEALARLNERAKGPQRYKKRLDMSRRQVATYFFSAWRQYEEGLISLRLLRGVTYVPGIHALHRAVARLSESADGSNDPYIAALFGLVGCPVCAPRSPPGNLMRDWAQSMEGELRELGLRHTHSAGAPRS